MTQDTQRPTKPPIRRNSVLCLIKTAASNLRGLPFLCWRTRESQHGLLPVQTCPHEQSPPSFPCHGQVTSKSTVAHENQSCSASWVSSAMSVSSPQSTASQQLRQLRVVGTRSSAQVHPLLAKLPVISSTKPISWTEQAARQFPSCSGRDTTSSTISAVFALDTFSECTPDLEGTHGLSTQGKSS